MSDSSTSSVGTLDQELLALMARGARRTPLAQFFAATVVAGCVYGRAPAPSVAGWLVWSAFAITLRRFILLGLVRDLRRSAKNQLQIVAGLAVLSGATFGTSVLFWPFVGELERAVVTMVILGLCAGAVATNLGYRPTFLCFLLSSAGPLCLAWICSPGTSRERWIEVSIGVLILLFGLILVMLAGDSFRLFSNAFESRRQQAVLNGQLRLALAEADAANRAKTRFLASASHDLRQPLHTVSLFGAALALQPLNERSRQIATMLNTALQSLGTQLDALLDISKLDAGVVSVQSTNIAVEPFLAAIFSDFEPHAVAKGLRMSLHCPPAITCHTDEHLLGRILRNLTDNAIKYTSVGFVKLSAFQVAGTVRFQVSDSGVGIAESEQGKVFEEFYQIDNPERDRTRGLGLGLSIVSRSARLLGLPLTLESSLSSGSVLSIDVPAGRDPQAPQPAPPGDWSDLVGVEVLVIDDEEAVRSGMRALLEGWGCTVRDATGTRSALEVVARVRPDILLVDFRLRDGDDGIAAIAAIRALHPSIPALLISGDTAPARLREAHAAGLQLLHKPVSTTSLSHAMSDELRTDRETRQ